MNFPSPVVIGDPQILLQLLSIQDSAIFWLLGNSTTCVFTCLFAVVPFHISIDLEDKLTVSITLFIITKIVNSSAYMWSKISYRSSTELIKSFKSKFSDLEVIFIIISFPLSCRNHKFQNLAYCWWQRKTFIASRKI